MLHNKYTKWYFNLISSRKDLILNNEIYYEKHHITPKCLGGSDETSNLVYLTPREHFIAHLLLVRMYEGEAQFKMKHAFSMMFIKSKKNKDRNVSISRLYDQLRKNVAKKVGESNKGRVAWNKGLPRDEYIKEAVSKANKGKVAWNKGTPRTEYERQKMKEGWANKLKEGYVSPNKGKSMLKTHICEYCKKRLTKGNYVRWHGNNCKAKNDV